MPRFKSASEKSPNFPRVGESTGIVFPSAKQAVATLKHGRTHPFGSNTSLLFETLAKVFQKNMSKVFKETKPFSQQKKNKTKQTIFPKTRSSRNNNYPKTKQMNSSKRKEKENHFLKTKEKENKTLLPPQKKKSFPHPPALRSRLQASGPEPRLPRHGAEGFELLEAEA